MSSRMSSSNPEVVGAGGVGPGGVGPFQPALFVIHAVEDEWFVKGALLPALGLPSASVLTTSKLGLGKLALSELERGLASASVTVVVLSHSFLADVWSGLASLLASHSEVAGRGQVVPLLLDDVSSPLYLAAKVALDLRAKERWDGELERLRALLGAPPPAPQEVPCPYPGMRAFGAADAKWFYGREREILELVSRLRAGEREVLVVGPSGSGKSSLVSAGVLPRLARGVFGMPPVLLLSLRPGAAPLARLAEALGAALDDLAAVRAALEGLLAPEREARLLVFVDQLEELFTLASDAERSQFYAAVTALRADERVSLLWGLRADFLGELMESELWPAPDSSGGLGDRVWQLSVAPLRGEALRAAVLRPALEVGVVFEPGLLERLLADTAGEAGALPLLQETLVQLWEQRAGRLLPLAAYTAMAEGERHGIAVAISRHGDACLRALPAAQVSAARRILLRLVSLSESPSGAPYRRDSRRPQAETALALGEDPMDFQAALEALVRHRLVTLDRTGDGEALVDLAHEALLTAWPALTSLLRTQRRDEAQRRRLCAKVAEWQERRSRDESAGLLDAFELAEAEDFLDREDEHALGRVPGLAELVLESRVERNAALRRRHEARPPRLVAPGSASEPRAGALPRVLGSGRAGCRALAFSQDGSRVAAAGDDTTAQIWDAHSGVALTPPLLHRAPVASLAFSADGGRLVTAAEDQTARVWDARTGAAVSPPLAHEDLLWGAALSPKGTRVVTACADRAARVWQVEEGLLSIPPLEHEAAVRCAAFSPRGDRVVTASADGTARVWDVASGKPVGPPLVHRDVVVHVAFHPAGHFVVTASRDQTACIWEVQTGRLAAPPLLHEAPVESAVFSSDGRALVTTSLGYTLHRFQVEVGTRARRRAPAASQQPLPAKLGSLEVRWKLECDLWRSKRTTAPVSLPSVFEDSAAPESSLQELPASEFVQVPLAAATLAGAGGERSPSSAQATGAPRGRDRPGPEAGLAVTEPLARGSQRVLVPPAGLRSSAAAPERGVGPRAGELTPIEEALRAGDPSIVAQDPPAGAEPARGSRPTLEVPRAELDARAAPTAIEGASSPAVAEPAAIDDSAVPIDPEALRSDGGAPVALDVSRRTSASIALPLVVRGRKQEVVQVHIAGALALATLADGKVCVLPLTELIDDDRRSLPAVLGAS